MNCSGIKKTAQMPREAPKIPFKSNCVRVFPKGRAVTPALRAQYSAGLINRIILLLSFPKEAQTGPAYSAGTPSERPLFKPNASKMLSMAALQSILWKFLLLKPAAHFGKFWFGSTPQNQAFSWRRSSF